MIHSPDFLTLVVSCREIYNIRAESALKEPIPSFNWQRNWDLEKQGQVV